MRRILIYGDSNTFGTGPMADLSDDPIFSKSDRWAGVMARKLGPNWDVVVEGLPGRTTVHADPIEGEHLNGLGTLRAILASHRPIDLLILALGTNDSKHRFGLTAQDIALSTARLIREAAATGYAARILVLCPPAVEERGDLAEVFRGAPARCAGLASQMARCAAHNGADFVDAGVHIAVDPLDGVHFSRESHTILGQAMAAKVREILP
ncbi:hypothetical protein IU397_16730 [Actibacterium sp. 188UL27-1]|nr:hypothetical protein [Actibacterium sp. 188UL27-1]